MTESKRRVVSPRLVGREPELDRLVSAVTEPPAVAVVEGEQGIGKTRLVNELRARPELAGSRVLIGSCRRIREPFPLSAVLEALRGVAGELDGVPLSPVAGALRPLLPELAPLLPPPPDPLEDRNAERHRVFRGLVELLGALGPVILVLEDLHWTDEHTLDFASYVLGDPPPNLSLVLTFRNPEVHPEVRALTSALPPVIGRADAVLGALDEQQTGALGAAILGVERVSEQLAAYLRERTAGVPLAVEELLALLRAQGALASSGTLAAGGGPLDVPSGIRDSVLARVGRLSEPARSVAEVSAVLQVPVPTSVLVTTCLIPEPRAQRGIVEALESGVFTERDGMVGLRHPLAAQAVYETIPGVRRQELHHRAASTLDALERPPLGQVAHHLRHAGRLDEWVVAAERAADQAIALGHDAEAARLLAEPLRRAPLDPSRRGRLAVKLGQAASGALHPAQEFIDQLWDVLAQELPAQVRGELRFWLVMLLEHTDADPRLLYRLLAEAVSELDQRPDLQAWAMMCLGCPVVPGVSRAERQYWLRRTRETLPAVGDPDFEVFLLGKVAMVLAVNGDPDWRRLTEKITDQLGEQPGKRSEVKVYHSIGQAACYAGHLATADRLLAAGLAGAVEYGSRQVELRVRAAQALLDYSRGDWDGLAETAQPLVGALADYIPSRLEVEVVASSLAAARGEPGEARERLEDLVLRLERRGGFDLLAIPAATLARLLVARGETGAAVAGVTRFLAAMESVGPIAPAVRALPAVTEAMLAAGQVAQARAVVTRYAYDLRELDAPLAPAALRHARGLVAAATGRWLPAVRHFEAAAQRYQASQCPYEAAQAHEQAALALLATGDGARRAEQLLRGAIATYQRLGASPDTARASRIARERGISVPARHRGGHRGYGSDLSPREWEVARLAAIGRTNKDIAAELFVSPHTVKKQLAAAMRKLDVHSRAELAHRLAQRGNNASLGP